MKLPLGPFEFRESSVPSGNALYAQTAKQIVAFWTLFLLVLPAAIFEFELLYVPQLLFASKWSMWFGAALFLIASALGLWSAISLIEQGGGTPLPAACPPRLVTNGPYAYVRNPMAVAGIVQGLGVGLFLGSALVLAYALAGGFLWHLAIRPCEERDLSARFGERYRGYIRAVRCWIPRLTPYRHV